MRNSGCRQSLCFTVHMRSTLLPHRDKVFLWIYHYNQWNVARLSFSKHQFEETLQILSLRSSNQSSLYILSFIQLNVSNTRLLLPEDLIIFLISNYFKDKWVHLASKQTCQWGTWETVPSLLLSLEINGWRSNLYIYLFICCLQSN